MRQSLIASSNSPPSPVTSIVVDVERPHFSNLTLHYTITGRVGEILIPRMAFPKRTDDLWKTTCFEAFIKPDPGERYCEFNFSPSTKWAAYRFDSFRAGMADIDEFEISEMDVQSNATIYEMKLALDLDPIPELRGNTLWHLAISTVIEDKNHNISYWALTHPPDKPDFHHPDCFALDVPGA